MARREYLTDEDFPVIPKRKQRTWYGLSAAERRQVSKAARRGESHADPVIALAAFTWARDLVTPGPWYRWPIEVVASLLDGGGSLGTSLAERRLAKRVLSARAPQSQAHSGP